MAYFDMAPHSTSAVAPISGTREPSNSPNNLKSNQPKRATTSKQDSQNNRPYLRTLESTQDIIQDRNVLQRISNAFAAF
ncbi:hypothetical protein BDZ97DRAFT_1821017 [Flammula alnicola]|nr:hypothetical protein BDZ97DRAFT_1821017 [Flammula alnicola]